MIWTSDRKQIIGNGNVLLRVTRPDLNAISRIRFIIWSIAIVAMMSVYYFSLQFVHEHPVFYFSLVFSLCCLLYLLLHVLINTHPIIFTDKGLMQAWVGAYLWEDIEEYRWFPMGRRFSMLKVFPSNSMPIFMQIDIIKGGFGLIHDSYSSTIEELFRQKGIAEQKWN